METYKRLGVELIVFAVGGAVIAYVLSGSLAAAGIALVISPTALLGWYGRNRTFHNAGFYDKKREQAVVDMIDDSLAQGAPVVEILTFLDARGIQRGEIQRAEFDPLVLDAGYPPETRTVPAILRCRSRPFSAAKEIHIAFVLDSSDRMKDYIVQETSATF